MELLGRGWSVTAIRDTYEHSDLDGEESEEDAATVVEVQQEGGKDEIGKWDFISCSLVDES